jgi:vacuolar-type H+-ATPase catalytic subunit A/Vma1
MMKCIVRFFDNAKRVISESGRSDKKISWAIINNSVEKLFLELSQMKFKDPKISKEEMNQYFSSLCDEIDNEFRKLVIG